MNNLSSYCGLVDAKIRASDKDLPVHTGLRRPWMLEYLIEFSGEFTARYYFRKQKTKLDVVHKQKSQISDFSTKNLSASMFKSLVFF